MNFILFMIDFIFKTCKFKYIFFLRYFKKINK